MPRLVLRVPLLPAERFLSPETLSPVSRCCRPAAGPACWRLAGARRAAAVREQATPQWFWRPPLHGEFPFIHDSYLMARTFHVLFSLLSLCVITFCLSLFTHSSLFLCKLIWLCCRPPISCVIIPLALSKGRLAEIPLWPHLLRHDCNIVLQVHNSISSDSSQAL